MKFIKIVAFVGSIALLSSCDYQKYNHIGQKDINVTNSYVYGPGLDSLPRQMANKYDAKPELEGRVNEIRNKMFSGRSSAVAKQ